MPALLPVTAGQMTSVDGHRIAYWARVAMHKGNITMLGRIMAGSQAVIAHNEVGHARCGTYSPPAMHVSQVIVDSCQKVAVATGTFLFVIDRAVQAVALARACDHQALGWRCMLDDNEQHGLESCAATLVDTRADGTQVLVASGTCPGPRIPGTLSSSSPQWARPWSIGVRPRSQTFWRRPRGLGCTGSATRYRNTASSA